MDQSRDYSGQVMYRISCLFDLPDFVKSAKADEVIGDEELPARLFADPARKFYPCHTAPATWMSAAYLAFEPDETLSKSARELAWNRVRAAGDYFQINSYLDDIVKRARDLAKQDSNLTDTVNLEDCALVVGQDGYYPMRNAEEVKTAAAYVERYKDRFPLFQRRQMARAILVKAAAYDVTDAAYEARLPWLHKQAGYGFCTATRAAELMFGRAKTLQRLGKDLENQEKLARLAKRCLEERSEATYDEEVLYKLANWIDDLDRRYDLRQKGGLPAPEDVLYELNVETLRKVASEHAPLANGAVFRKEDLRRLPVDGLRDTLGYEKSAELYDNIVPDDGHVTSFALRLSRDEADEVEAIAAAAGIMPVYRLRPVKQAKFMDRLAELAALPV